jgi:hypothetical protein
MHPRGRIWLLPAMVVEKWRAAADEEATTTVDGG